jgi:hypothetical protein
MSSDASLEEVRAELIRLLESPNWEIVKSAREAARPILQDAGQRPSAWAIPDYITDLLRKGFPFHPIPLGEPPGSAGVGYVMNNADGRGLYIKVKIERDRTDGVVGVVILSFHISKHYKG